MQADPAPFAGNICVDWGVSCTHGGQRSELWTQTNNHSRLSTHHMCLGHGAVGAPAACCQFILQGLCRGQPQAAADWPVEVDTMYTAPKSQAARQQLTAGLVTMHPRAMHPDSTAATPKKAVQIPCALVRADSQGPLIWSGRGVLWLLVTCVQLLGPWYHQGQGGHPEPTPAAINQQNKAELLSMIPSICCMDTS